MVTHLPKLIWLSTVFCYYPPGVLVPDFLVSQNFYVLKTYNESDVYALFVGHVADRMKAGSRFQRGWSRLSSFSRAHVKAAQLKLEKGGADVGGADGLIGYKTRTSIGNWQSKNNLEGHLLSQQGHPCQNIELGKNIILDHRRK